MEFDVIVKGVRYQLIAYNFYRNEYDLYMNDKLVLDSKPYNVCVKTFIKLIGD